MKKRVLNSIIIVISICISSFLMGINPYIGLNSTKNPVEHDEAVNLKISETFNATEINDLPSSSNNWSWAKSQDICTGSGTQSDPYVIDGHIFQPTLLVWDCLRIIHSRKYFTITNCEFRYAPSVYSGIFLANVTNGRIIDNSFYGNMYGIYALETNDTLISENSFYSNRGDGFFISNSHGNSIINNNISLNNWQGMYMEFGTNNMISENIANANNLSGIVLNECDYSTVSDNTLNLNKFSGLRTFYNTFSTIENNVMNENNREGIYFRTTLNSSIIGNTMEKNGFDAIYVRYSNGTVIKENIMNENVLLGIRVGANTRLNKIFLNCFDNTVNAEDNGINNQWDNGIKGNYWADYTGVDTDSNGVGDVPYNLTGSTGSQDYFPLMTCPLDVKGIPGFNIFITISVILFSIGIIWVINRKKLYI